METVTPEWGYNHRVSLKADSPVHVLTCTRTAAGRLVRTQNAFEYVLHRFTVNLLKTTRQHKIHVSYFPIHIQIRAQHLIQIIQFIFI